MNEDIKCSICGKDAVNSILRLCSEHEIGYYYWKKGLRFHYGDKPNEWVLLASFLLSKKLKEQDKEKKEDE